MSVKLGVPSKGRLMEKTFDWFAARGITPDPHRLGARIRRRRRRASTGSNWCCFRPARSRANWRRGAFTWA